MKHLKFGDKVMWYLHKAIVIKQKGNKVWIGFDDCSISILKSKFLKLGWRKPKNREVKK